MNGVARRAVTFAPEHLCNELHPEADSQWDAGSRGPEQRFPHDLGADAGLIWPERSRRDYDSVGRERLHFAQGDAVRAVDNTTPAGGFEGLHQIPGKGIA